MKNFTVPEYFDPPHETQLKSLLQGAEAEPLSNGLIFIRQLKLQTFDEKGAGQMVVHAPRCVFDTTRRTVSSAGPLEVESDDGKLHLQGQGFLWCQTNLDLIISNTVHTTIRGGMTNSFLP